MGWLKRIFGGGDAEGEPSAARQEGDPTVLDRAGDPRGGTQSDDYRHADPRELVDEGGTVMGGPGGAPQEGLTADERRRLDRKTD